MTEPVLEVDRLSITLRRESGDRILVEDCTLAVARGETLGLVGESGSGKTLSTRAIAGLIAAPLETGGAIRIDGADLSGLRRAEMTDLRAHRLGMVFQTPRAHLNPLRTVGDFLTEAMVHVDGRNRADALSRAAELLDEVGIDEPKRRLRQKPGELSGGLLQRVMIASALAMDPDILLADEITTALDVTTQEEVMAVIADLRRERDLAMLFVTHDLALARAVCDRIAVMRDGRTIETHDAETIEADARDGYTRALLSASLPAPLRSESTPGGSPIIEIAGLRKEFSVRAAVGRRREKLVAVDGVGFELHVGESLGIVGESGSGKSTTARILCGLDVADAGSIIVDGQAWDAPARTTAARRRRAQAVQMIFQDPYQSLDPRQRVRACLDEAITVARKSRATAGVRGTGADSAGREHRSRHEWTVDELMSTVGLDPSLADATPRGLSGGQRQRVAIARALAADPKVLVLDEAVSALDVTAQVEILTLLDGIRRSRGVALLMISHDLTTVRRLCDRVVVMRHGRIVEQGPIAQVLDSPSQDYTKQLIDSIPREGWQPRRRVAVV